MANVAHMTADVALTIAAAVHDAARARNGLAVAAALPRMGRYNTGSLRPPSVSEVARTSSAPG